MDNITITDNIYNIACLKMIDISKTPIHIPQGLPQVSLKNLDKITDKQVLYLSMLYPPMALPPHDTSYELSGRSWFQLQVNHHITKIPFLVLKDKTQFLGYYRRKFEVNENSAIEFVITSLVKLTSKATLARRKAKAAHRHLSRSSLDAINNLNHHFWWDRDCLKLDELNAIYAACATQWSKSDQFDRIIIFILLLLHFRYDSVSLLKLSLNKSCTPRLQKIDQQLYLIIAPPIKRSYESFAGCRTATSTIYLPVPAKLSRLIESKLETSIDFFEYTGIDGLKKHLELHQIVQFLNKLIPESCTLAKNKR